MMAAGCYTGGNRPMCLEAGGGGGVQAEGAVSDWWACVNPPPIANVEGEKKVAR